MSLNLKAEPLINYLRRVNGSRHIYSKQGERKVISIPVHGNKNLKPGLAVRIARDAILCFLKWIANDRS